LIAWSRAIISALIAANASGFSANSETRPRKLSTSYLPTSLEWQIRALANQSIGVTIGASE